MSELTDKLRERLELETGNWCIDYVSGWAAKTESLAPLHELLIELTSAVQNLGLKCVNTGYYGQLKISPGECRCSTCNIKRVITKLSDEVEK